MKLSWPPRWRVFSFPTVMWGFGAVLVSFFIIDLPSSNKHQFALGVVVGLIGLASIGFATYLWWCNGRGEIYRLHNRLYRLVRDLEPGKLYIDTKRNLFWVECTRVAGCMDSYYLLRCVVPASIYLATGTWVPGVSYALGGRWDSVHFSQREVRFHTTDNGALVPRSEGVLLLTLGQLLTAGPYRCDVVSLRNVCREVESLTLFTSS